LTFSLEKEEKKRKKKEKKKREREKRERERERERRERPDGLECSTSLALVRMSLYTHAEVCNVTVPSVVPTFSRVGRQRKKEKKRRRKREKDSSLYLKAS